MVHLITFELGEPRRPHEPVRIERAIKEMGPSFAFSPTSWIVECELPNEEICDRLRDIVRPDDRVVSTRIHRDWVAANIPQAEADWLGSRNFTSLGDVPSPVRRIPTVRG